MTDTDDLPEYHEGEFTDPLHDPNYPDRPQTNDFWRLSDVSLWLDAKVENLPGDEPPDVERDIAAYVDPDSFLYVMASRTLNALGRPLTQVEFACYVEGFLMGARFAELGGHRDE